jgi:hypothetical protein
MTTARTAAGHGVRQEGRHVGWWLMGLLAGLVLLYLPFTAGTTSWMVWTWPLGGALLFLSVRGIGGATGGLGDQGRTHHDEVGRWLGQLGGRCQVLRYVDAGGRAVEYVVVAPSGVYAIQTRNVRGRLRVRGEGLVLNDRPLSADLTARAAEDARALESRLARAGLPHEVRPLVVFTDARIDVRDAGGVTLLPLRWLESYVRTRPQELSGLELGLVGGALRREARALLTR